MMTSSILHEKFLQLVNSNRHLKVHVLLGVLKLSHVITNDHCCVITKICQKHQVHSLVRILTIKIDSINKTPNVVKIENKNIF